MSKTDAIKRLAEFTGAEGSEINDTFYEIEELLYLAGATEIQTDFEEGGRWYNYQTVINRVDTPDGEIFYSVHQQVPASEIQDGMDLSWEFNEVFKREKTVIVYE